MFYKLNYFFKRNYLYVHTVVYDIFCILIIFQILLSNSAYSLILRYKTSLDQYCSLTICYSKLLRYQTVFC